ncbi:cupin domain-containing protein [Aquimarina intermedia]|uniref:Cupin domain-containing protein n=1 Tax=Aquimarina intermedia TaxID=350814 RepID=A0A5S5BVK4_9FLAO|nr:cupin domain-containing protein [Aquimarina intermedia]TYP71019.1 Cupin domain-containing protein [Aquimarina intermedia]
MSNTNKRFSNPIIKDEIEILYESDEKLVFRTYLHADGGQSGLHYHTKITEKFKVIDGELTVSINKTKIVLKPNEEAVINPSDVHQFVNTSNAAVVFEVEITPSLQIKKALQIFYGLAKDVKVYNNGLPKNIFYMAIGLHMMDAYIPNVPRSMQRLGITTLALIGEAFGLKKKLLLRYCS